MNTIGINEDVIKRYVKYQEDEEKRDENNSKGYDLFSNE